MRILTNAPGQQQSPTWRARSTLIAPSGDGWVASLRLGFRLFRQAKSFDAVVVGAGRSDVVYSLLKAFFPRRQPICIRIDCLWSYPPSPLRTKIKQLIFAMQRRAVNAYVVWASREIEAYGAEFGIPRTLLHFVPYHHTLNDFDETLEAGNYLFSGGNVARDYKTLLEAVRGIDYPVKIGCNRKSLFDNLRIPRHVEVISYPHDQYIRAMAGCRVNIVSLAPNLLHSGGQQTFLNSMALGKPTIVTDPDGAKDYIDNGKTGLLVPAGDAEALRAAIERLLNDPGLTQQMGERARAVRQEYSTEHHFRRLVALIERISESSDADP